MRPDSDQVNYVVVEGDDEGGVLVTVCRASMLDSEASTLSVCQTYPSHAAAFAALPSLWERVGARLSELWFPKSS
jgi:hypothetical protein